jgi:dienelactone hydrolase
MHKSPHYIILFFVFLVIGSAHSQSEASSETPADLAKLFVSSLAIGDYENCVSGFDSTMKSLMSVEKTEEIWKDLIQKLGRFQKQLAVREEKYQQYDIILVTCQFESSQIDIKVVYDPQRQVAGLFFVPTKPAQEYEAPNYVTRKTFDELEVSFGDNDWRLPGIVSLPKGSGPFPAVILVHGSGPNDRDETIGPNKPFRDLAWGLASKGIAVLRYDKRTKIHGTKMVSSNIPLTVQEETVDDALYAVAKLKDNSRIDSGNIFVLGHSLGGMLIPRIGISGSSIKGFIIMAGATRPLEDIMIEQFEYIFSLDGNLAQEENDKLNKLKEEVKKIKELKDSDSASLQERVLGASPSYWLDLREYDPAGEAAGLHKAMLVLQGKRDYQVTTVDFDRWKKALSLKKNVTFKLYPQLNHLFMAGKGKSSPQEYQIPAHVSYEVIEDISYWIKTQSSVLLK